MALPLALLPTTADVATKGLKSLVGKIKSELINKLPVHNDNKVIRARNEIREKMYSVFSKKEQVSQYMDSLFRKYKIRHDDISKRGRSKSYYQDKYMQVGAMAEEILETVFFTQPKVIEEWNRLIPKHNGGSLSFDHMFKKAVNKISESDANIFKSTIGNYDQDDSPLGGKNPSVVGGSFLDIISHIDSQKKTPSTTKTNAETESQESGSAIVWLLIFAAIYKIFS